MPGGPRLGIGCFGAARSRTTCTQLSVFRDGKGVSCFTRIEAKRKGAELFGPAPCAGSGWSGGSQRLERSGGTLDDRPVAFVEPIDLR